MPMPTWCSTICSNRLRCKPPSVSMPWPWWDRSNAATLDGHEHQIRDGTDQHVVELSRVTGHEVVTREHDRPRRRRGASEDLGVEEVADPNPPDRERHRGREIVGQPGPGDVVAPTERPQGNHETQGDAVRSDSPLPEGHDAERIRDVEPGR